MHDSVIQTSTHLEFDLLSEISDTSLQTFILVTASPLTPIRLPLTTHNRRLRAEGRSLSQDKQ
jgi:hypothetical protein